jgi:hypothetical protein
MEQKQYVDEKTIYDFIKANVKTNKIRLHYGYDETGITLSNFIAALTVLRNEQEEEDDLMIDYLLLDDVPAYRKETQEEYEERTEEEKKEKEIDNAQFSLINANIEDEGRRKKLKAAANGLRYLSKEELDLIIRTLEE